MLKALLRGDCSEWCQNSPPQFSMHKLFNVAYHSAETGALLDTDSQSLARM